MADNAHRSQDGQIDLITYRTGVKDVVVILGSLPAGDAMAGTGNIAIPTLTGMMLDRGNEDPGQIRRSPTSSTTSAREISFGSARKRCKFGQVPQQGPAAGARPDRGGTRSPGVVGRPNSPRQSSSSSAHLQDSLQNTEARAQEALSRARSFRTGIRIVRTRSRNSWPRPSRPISTRPRGFTPSITARAHDAGAGRRCAHPRGAGGGRQGFRRVERRPGLHPARPERGSGPREAHHGAAERQAERLGDHRSADGLALSRPGCAGAAGRARRCSGVASPDA